MAKSKGRGDDGRLGPHAHKIAPVLRMLANGNDEVNTVRSECRAGLRAFEPPRGATKSPLRAIEAFALVEAPRKMKQAELPSTIEANVFVRQNTRATLGDDAACDRWGDLSETARLRNPRRRADLVAGAVRLSDLPALASEPSVMSIEMAETLRTPRAILGTTGNTAPPAKARRFDDKGGEGILIGIIDVDGFDWSHEDFLDESGAPRFVSIWDQGGKRRPPPAPYTYGSELTRDHLVAALGGNHGVAPTIYEPQSSMVEGSHGTHVASIAAGRRGVCHKADIAAVLISLGEGDFDRRKSFYDSTRLADAVDYLLAVAERLGKPISINVSLGTNGHAHDGSSAISRWIDSALAVPGRSVCVAAGNAGQERPENESDFGYMLGRIHTSGKIPAQGLTTDLDWIVLGAGFFDVSENELELWYGAADRFGISLKPPGMDWTERVDPGQFIENRQLPDGSFFSIYNEVYHPANGGNYIGVYLSPYLSESLVRGVRAGTWKVRLHGLDVRDGRFDGWIERDDPVRHDGAGKYWSFPSFFAVNSNVDRSSVSSLACGQNVIAVANLIEGRDRVNISSSQGPTRDGRPKPEIAAPGTDIIAACGFSPSKWIAMTGTSMASPFVAGVAGLMLGRRRSLTAAQIRGILQRTARPLPGHSYDWRDDAGYGAIRPDAALYEADGIDQRRDLT